MNDEVVAQTLREEWDTVSTLEENQSVEERFKSYHKPTSKRAQPSLSPLYPSNPTQFPSLKEILRPSSHNDFLS